MFCIYYWPLHWQLMVDLRLPWTNIKPYWLNTSEWVGPFLRAAHWTAVLLNLSTEVAFMLNCWHAVSLSRPTVTQFDISLMKTWMPVLCSNSEIFSESTSLPPFALELSPTNHLIVCVSLSLQDIVQLNVAKFPTSTLTSGGSNTASAPVWVHACSKDRN